MRSSLAIMLIITASAAAQVTGPGAVKVGDLVVLRSESESQWVALDPVDLQYAEFESGRAVAFSAGLKPGKIVVLCVAWDAKRLDRHIVDVGGGPAPPNPIPPTPDDVWPDIVTMVAAACQSVPSEVAVKLPALASNFRTVRATIVALPESAFDRAKSSEQLRILNAAVLPEKQRDAMKELHDTLKSLGKTYDNQTKSRAGYAQWLESIAQGIERAKK